MFDVVQKRWMIGAGVILASIVFLQCSSERDGFVPAEDAGPSVAPLSDAATADPDAEPPLEDCADENKLVYVLSKTGNELHRFNPETSTFAKIGRLRCPTSSSVFSMAIDRRGNAWVEYADGRIFKVDTKDASCSATPYRPGQLGFTTFGMGFVRDDNDAGAPLTESLFIAGTALGRLDLASLQVSLVGTETHGIGEIAGTASGKLYIFLRLGSRIVRLDKSTGAILETYRPDVTIGNGGGFAFAQWGGDFFMFTVPDNETTRVTRYSPATDTTKIVLEDTGLIIVGAGSSTCAPSEPVR